MDLNEPGHPNTGVTPNGEISVPPRGTAPVASLQCDECAAPVAEEQRYCVACGAHRRHVSDPAAHYLSQVSARSRTTRAAATARRTPQRSSRLSGIGVAVVIALIPAGAAAGVLAGRSSNNDDASLIRALSRQQATDHAAAATTAGSGTVASASTTGTGRRAKAKGSAAGHDRNSGQAGSRRGHHRGAGGKSTPTSTKATAISTAPPSAAAKATGAKVTAKVQKATGKSYVNGQSGLPGTVVVP